jgi:hypothetical protein
MMNPVDIEVEIMEEQYPWNEDVCCKVDVFIASLNKTSQTNNQIRSQMDRKKEALKDKGRQA